MTEVVLAIILVLFLVAIIGAAAFAAPMLRALSERIAGRISADAGPVSAQDLARLHEAVHQLDRQVQMLEEQQRFLEQLVAGQKTETLPPADRNALPAAGEE